MQHDRFRAGEYAPDYEEQNELAMVVQVVVNLFFINEKDHYLPLNAVGFGATGKGESVPFVADYLAALVRRVRHHCSPANLRVLGHLQYTPPVRGLKVHFVCVQYTSDGEVVGPAEHTGETYSEHTLDTGEYQNHCVWYEQYVSQNTRQYDSVIYSRILLEDTLHLSGYEACIWAFGETGYPLDRRAITKEVRYPGQPLPTSQILMPGSPNVPRTVDEFGAVVGQVTHLDAANVLVTIDVATGDVSVDSTNLLLVPAERASAIERALNAVVSYGALITAHEVGHLLGADASPSYEGAHAVVTAERFPMPDGQGPWPYMKQDIGGHDSPPTLTGLMVNSTLWPRGQLLRRIGPERTFRPAQVAYLRTVLPKAEYFASRNDGEGL